MENKNSIKKYFKGKNIFLTGGSGFLGKALIEKLLRSCPELGTIYILLRPKKGKGLQERLENITSCPLFDLLKKSNPESIKKIVPVNGNTAELGLGLSSEDRQLLITKVHMFYHVAASVKFDDALKDAIFVNVRSAREAALLALEMKHLEFHMHVSTTYCNIDGKKEIEEILYPSHGNWKEAIEAAESCDPQTFDVLAQKYIGTFPNTYTFTKLLAEHCVNELLVGKVPTIICRPSVVVSTILEPFEGWIDNFNGPVGLLLAGGSGLLRTVYGGRKVDTDYIAVDNVVKLMITAGWHKVNYSNKDELSIYHASKYNQVANNQEQLVKLGKRLYWDVPFAKKIWFPGNTMTHCWYNYFINVLLFHMIPAVMVDLLLRAFGYKPFLFKIQRKIYIGNMAVSYFMLNEWWFINTKSFSLLEFIPENEMIDFNFKVMPVGDQAIYQYYAKSCDYARKHLLMEKGDISEETRVRTRRMYYLDRTMRYLFYALAVWTVLFKINILKVICGIICKYIGNL
ncbi:unnamed protein product [Ceutorhynchus assimilis]|uniref:Fatty acyl-CoA reductase n=1 Tax=Ceutorhynchus assimilis TaxID=467358 RepID=A0A9N9MVN3_9CUCU|nr:unnamed protein product [Ceutorhynchus assimilis]